MHFVSWRKRALPSPPTPMMSSKTTFPHRIGGSRHKFPENSQPISPPPSPPPPPHPSTGQPLTSCLKNRHFYNFFHPHYQRKPQISLPDFLSSRLSCARWGKSNRVAIMEMVKKKIQTLQQQVDEAEERELGIQRELDSELELREKVREFSNLFTVSFRSEKNHLLLPEILILVWF